MDLACFVSCFSGLASVLRCMSVRTSMLLPFPPFSFRAPFPPFRALLGCPFRLASGRPPVRHSPGLGEWCTVRFGRLLSCKFQLPFPLRLPASRSCPVRPPCFRYPTGPASVPLTPCTAPRLPLVFCRQAYGPCPSSSFRLAPFALASPAPAQHGFPHSSWLSSVLALVSLSAP